MVFFSLFASKFHVFHQNFIADGISMEFVLNWRIAISSLWFVQLGFATLNRRTYEHTSSSSIVGLVFNSRSQQKVRPKAALRWSLEKPLIIMTVCDSLIGNFGAKISLAALVI